MVEFFNDLRHFIKILPHIHISSRCYIFPPDDQDTTLSVRRAGVRVYTALYRQAAGQPVALYSTVQMCTVSVQLSS